MSTSHAKPFLYVEAQPPPSEDKRANRTRHRESLAEAAEELQALAWQSSDIDHWLVDVDQAARVTAPGQPLAWTSYYRPVYRLDFDSKRDWRTIRRQLERLLPGWRIALWAGTDAPANPSG